MQKWYNVHNKSPKEDTHMKPTSRAAAMLLSVLFLITSLNAILPVYSAESIVYLSDRQDLFLGRESLDGFGWDTAHSGEPITIGKQKFDKGLGFHCLPDKDAYCEFDISSLGMKYFAASVGVLKDAGYFIEWGSISFHVYGDGKLLASTPMISWNEEPYLLTCSVEGVKTLRLVEKNENGHACDAGVWGDARLTTKEPTQNDQEEDLPMINPDKTDLPQPEELTGGDHAYASDLYWITNQAYSGGSAIRDGNCAGEYIWSCDLKRFPKGIGIHAASSSYTAYVDINIASLGYTKFASWYGVCETLSGNDISMAAVKFAVFGDGAKLFESGTMRYNQPMEYAEVDVTGVKTLRLAVAGAPSISGAWCVWGGAVLSKSGDVSGIKLCEELVLDATTSETEPPTDPETDVPTDPATEAPTETAGAVTEPDTQSRETDPVGDAPTEEDSRQETDPPAKGCGSALTGAAALSLAAAAVAVLRKRKED